jgi:hypothetical protein
MAHYAKLGLNSKVIDVVVVDNEDILDKEGEEVEQLGIESLINITGYPFWIQTSYNGSIRKNYAGVGYRYDEDRDAFIPPKPYSSWVLDEETCKYEAPVPYPEDGEAYQWNEELINWVLDPIQGE